MEGEEQLGERESNGGRGLIWVPKAPSRAVPVL